MARVVAVAALLILCSVALAADKPSDTPPAPQSTAARNAIDKFAKAKTAIERKAIADENDARTKLVNELKALRAADIKRGDDAGLEEAVALAAVIKRTEEDIQTAAAPGTTNRGPVQLQVVKYGAGKNWVDVTSKAAKLIRGNALELPSDLRNMAEQDPAPNEQKFVDLIINVSGTPVRVYANDHTAMRIEIGK
jgi:hypothetical protein